MQSPAPARRSWSAEAAPAGEHKSLLETYLREQAARVLRVNAADIPASSPLSQLGLDSLMTVELMNRIEADLRININTGGLLGGQSIAGLAADLLADAGGRLGCRERGRIASRRRAADGSRPRTANQLPQKPFHFPCRSRNSGRCARSRRIIPRTISAPPCNSTER